MTVLNGQGPSIPRKISGPFPARPIQAVPTLLSARAACALLASSFLTASLAACAGTPEPKAENHACFRALDCRAGLVCVDGRCTADLTPIVPEVTAGTPAPEAPAADAGPEYE